MAEPGGLEPLTFRVTGGRSNQLSYGSMYIVVSLLAKYFLVAESGIAPLTLGL